MAANLHGLVHIDIPNNIEAALRYTDGGTCDSYFSVYHNHDGQQYSTGTILSLTQDMNPWAVEMNTTLNRDYYENLLEFAISFQSPIMDNPFVGTVMYNITSMTFDFEIEGGMEEKAVFSLSSLKKSDDHLNKFLGSAQFDSPWTDPVTLNISGNYDNEKINANFEFTSSLPTIHSFSVESSVNFVKPGEIKIHFLLTHDDVIALWALSQNFTSYGLVHKIEGSVNTVTVTYDFETTWDYFYAPVSASGHLALLNLMDHNLELSLSLKKAKGKFVSEVFGSWDDHTFKAGYTLDYSHPLKWKSDISVAIPGYDDVIIANISLNAINTFTNSDISMHITSPWTAEYELKFTSQASNDIVIYEVEILQAATHFLKVLLESHGLIDLPVSDLDLKLTSALFDDIHLKWQHNVETEKLFFLESAYGTSFFVQGKSQLKFSDDWFNQDFIFYKLATNITVSEPHLSFDMSLNLNSDSKGDFTFHFNEYSVSFLSDIFSGTIFQTEIIISDDIYKAELAYDKGGRNLLSEVVFKIVHNDADVVTSKLKLNSYYPQFDASLSFMYATQDNSTSHSGDLEVSAQLDYNYGIKGIARLTTNLEGFENYSLSIDTDLVCKDNEWSSFFVGQLQLNDDVFGIGGNVSLVLVKKILFEFGGHYNVIYEGIQDMKDSRFFFSLTKEVCTIKVAFLSGYEVPSWELFLIYKINEKKIKGHVILGAQEKYSLSSRLDTKIFTLDAEIEKTNGTNFKLLQGNVNWIFKPEKQLILINMNSDYDLIKKVTGKLTIRGLAAHLDMKVNEEVFSAMLRLIEASSKNPGKMQIKIDNKVYHPFSAVIDVEFLYDKEGFKIDLNIEFSGEKDWITANLNFGLPQSYLRFKTPFEDIENINLTLVAQRDEDYNLTLTLDVPQFCFKLSGVLDHRYAFSSVNILIDLECSGATKFEFLVKYNLEQPLTFNTKLDLNGDIIFDIEIACTLKRGDIDFKMEGSILKEYSLGLTFKFSWKKEEDVIVNLQIYEPSSNNTFFRTENIFSSKRSSIQMELLQDNSITFETSYGVSTKPLKLMIDSNYSHSLFGHNINIQFGANGNATKKAGHLDVQMSSDTFYDHVNFTSKYNTKKDVLEALFHIATPTGNADINGTYQFTRTKVLIVDMLSSLHTFQDYHYEVVYKPDRNKSLKFVSAQDDIKFEFMGEILSSESQVIKLMLDTPYKAFKGLNITFGYPKDTSGEISYVFYMSVQSNGDYYIIDARPSHHHSWKSGNLEINCFSPYDALRNTTLFLVFDLNNHMAVGIEGRRGRLGLNGLWKQVRSGLNIRVDLDMSYFGQGEFTLATEIPFDVYQTKLKLSRQKSNSDFVFQFGLGEAFRNGLFNLILIDMNSNAGNKTYSFSYNYNRKLNINGQFGPWEAMVGLELYGYPNSFMSGKFEINTNVQNYISIEGTWDISHRGSIYNAQLQVDINKKGLIILDGTFDTQANYAATPWDSVKLDILFESPFTLSHHIHAEYQLRILTFSASYQYGLDTFYINAGAIIHPTFGTVTFMGKIPVYGFSSFDLKVKYTLTDSKSSTLMISVEETVFETSFEVTARGLDGSFKLALSSPYFNPVSAKLTWSQSFSSVFLEINVSYGIVKGNAKMTLEYSDTFANFNLDIITPFDGASKVAVRAKYDIADVSKMFASLSLGVDLHSIDLKGDFTVRKEKASLNINGSLSFFGISGNFGIELKKNKDTYEISLNGNIAGLKPFTFDVSLDIYHLHFSWTYDAKKILLAAVDYENTNIIFNWDKYNYFNLTAYRQALKYGHEFGLKFVNQDEQTVSLYASYIFNKGHKLNLSINSSLTDPVVLRAVYTGNNININLSYGERVFNFSSKFIFNPNDSKGTITLNFDSTDDPQSTLVVNAFYDLRAFIQGDMTSTKNLTYFSFEWGEKVDFSLQGMRNPKQLKLHMDMKMPFKFLPKLRAGFEWELSSDVSEVHFGLKSYLEWSQKVAFAGQAKFARDMRYADIKGIITTPLSLFEEVAAGVVWKENRAEALISYNKAKWRLSCDYSLSPFSTNVILETPISGYETITFNAALADLSLKFELFFEFTWPEAKAVSLQISLERLKLEIGIITPWTPFKNVLLFASLMTESEEVVMSATLQWDERRASATVALSPLRYEVSGKYYFQAEEIAFAKGEVAILNREIQADAVIKTPLESLKLLNVSFHLDVIRSFSFKANLNDVECSIVGVFTPENMKVSGVAPFLGNLSWNLETKRSWEELRAYATFVPSETDNLVNVSFSYKYEYYPFSVKSVFEVKGDETLAYVELDLQEIWRISVDVLGNTIDVKITVPSRDETNVYIHFESNDLELESCTLDIIGKYGKFWEFLNINSTLSFKIRDQFLSRHELVLLVTNDLRYFTADFELFSDYLSEPFHVKIKIPLFNVFTEEGVIELSQSSGGKVVYQLLYKTLLPSRWLIYREIVITTLDWTSSLSIELARDALKIMVSYPDAIKAHVLRLTWTDDLNPERFVLGVEVISPYLDKGQYKFDVRFSLRGKVHFKIESELIFGTKRTVLKGLLHYNRRQQEMRFETQLTSDWFGDHSADFSIDWERDILVNGKLQLLEVEHSLSITISIEDFMMDITLVSPFLAQKTILITAKLEQGESGYIVEGKYTDMENNFTLRGKLESYGINYYSASANVAHNGKDIFEMSSTFYAEDPLIKFKFGINSVVTELNTNVVFEYDDNARQRFMSFIFHNAYLLNEDIELSVVSDREWNRPQSLYFKYNHIYIELLSSFSDSNTRVTASVRYTYKTIHIEYSLEDFGKKADILIITPFTFLQKLQMSYDIESDDKYFYFKYRREDEPIEFSSHLSIDDVMGRAIGLELRTPFKGYEKFIIFSPQFNKNNDRNFIALLEYPGGKIGFSLIADVKSWYNTNMLVALYLPFEDYEVFSFQFVVTDPKYAVEARVGKFGFTFSIMVDVVADNDIIELKIRLNEYAFTLQLKQLALGHMTHRLEYGIHMDFKLHDLLFDINQLDFEVKYFVGERIQFLAKSDKEEYLNLHYGWNWHQVITIATPKWYPGYFHVNFESKDDLDDYRIELGLSPGILSDNQDYWDTYGFQVHQDILEGGRHLLLSVEGFGSQFSLEGAAAVTALHLNKTLIFELNHRKLGYEILFQRQPGFLSDVYIEDVFLLFPNQTVHLNTSAETSSRQFDLNSRFTWNEHDIDMPPITLRVIYDDKSLFDQQDHHLMAIFRHPDIKEITFQGNVTKFFDASLNGLGEFIDYNVPEKTILLILNVDPVTHDEGQTIQLNLSQPYSNFSLNFDAQIIKSIFHQADYEFRYWSASKEKHEELFISTVSNSTENGSAFTIDILSPENDWGFSYDGSYFASESKAGFYVQEISKEYNDYWVFEVNLNRYLPQLEAMLHIGQENEDPYETGRIRVGMHNPLDMGAIIDHQRFGVWEKDGELGLNLKTKSFINYILRDQDVLQFLLKYDPSLDYYDDDFLQRLFSPADQILDVWKRDMNSTLSALIDWGSQELPLLAEALVNQDTLDSIWSREDSNFEYLMTDFNTGIADTYDDVVTMWTSVLLPAWEASYNFVTKWGCRVTSEFRS
ncbi:hypothetical protein SK128_008229 [Halocaridina rubra]|uniref:Uncharacterized protein n=1 Tax=Halocaridina rubra TaxID=373956 RepID=A0AAN9A8T5_HALRR